MSDDLKTTISGVVGALAIMAQWIAGKFSVDLGITADVLGAITLLAGVYIAWKVAKNHKAIAVIFLVIALGLAGSAAAQTWKPTNQVTVGWDAVTAPSGTISYKVYARPELGGPAALMTTVPTTQATVTFTQEGRFFLGVSTVRTVGGVAVESSTISWSSDPAVTFQAQTFGVEYIIPAPAPVGIRPLN